jgi:hypothetical protein
MLLLHDNPLSIVLLHNDDGEWATSRLLRAFAFLVVPTSHYLKDSTPNPLTQDPHTCSLRNSTPHIRNLNLHTCSLKHFSFTYETATLSRHMRVKNPIVKAHGRETKKHRVKLEEAPKLMHFWVSPYIFFICFQLTLAFWLHPKFWPNSSWEPWVLANLQITLINTNVVWFSLFEIISGFSFGIFKKLGDSLSVSLS